MMEFARLLQLKGLRKMFDRRRFVQGIAIPILAMPTSTRAADGPTIREAQARSMPKRYDVIPQIHSDLKTHGTIFERKIHKVGDNVYSAVGWSTCNTIMVVGTDGVIIVDTGSEIQSAREVAAEFRKITDKPVRAVIYTCFHLDHISGVKGHVSVEDMKSGNVAVISHETLLANVIKQAGTIAPILGPRTAYNFGAILVGADIEAMNNGTGPVLRWGGEVSFIAPTRTFAKTLEITVAGVAMNLIHVPSEAADEIAIFLPDSKILLSAEVIPAQHFPALHTLRGEAFRDPRDWYQSIDILRRFKAAAMVPSHGLPVIGTDTVEEVLRNYRDAIQYVHDQTVRQMNKGLTPDQLVQVVKLPPHLTNYRPWMQEFFGSVTQSVRGIYQGYLGWFEGDPVALSPLPKADRARRELELMGGRDRALAAASKAFEDGETQWAAELATRLIHVNLDDKAARQLKAAAFRKLGYAQINAIWRNWYLSAAQELDGFDLTEFVRGNARAFVSPDLVAALPARAFVEGLATRLKAEDTLDVTMTVGFRFPDVDEAYGVVIRQGVVQVDDHLPDKTDLTLTLDKAALDRIRLGQLTMRDALLGGAVKVSNAWPLAVARFFGYFELPFSEPIRLAVR
jgi:alkyl sulfatase BDS1-like metallo-beta-lactamase superfamily hydrolase